MGAFKVLDFSTERYILPEEVIFLAVLIPYVAIHIAVNAAIIIWYIFLSAAVSYLRFWQDFDMLICHVLC